MDIRRLSYFVAVAEEAHFGRAAVRLGIAQPPLSRQIAQLEADLGALLFDRSRSQIRLTQAGTVLLERSRDILELIGQAEGEVRRIGEGSAGRLRIAFVGSATYGVLPDVIKAFRSEYPDVELSLSAMNNAELKRAAIQREIDIAVARPSLADEELKTEILHREPLILAVPKSECPGGGGAVHLLGFRSSTFILYPRDPRPSFADHALKLCMDHGFIPGSQLMAQDFQTAISLVAVGVGLCIVPASVSLSERAGVEFRPISEPNPGTAISLNYRRDNRTPHLVNFLRIARRFADRPSLRQDARAGPAAAHPA